MKNYSIKYCLTVLVALVFTVGCDKEVSQTPTAPTPSEGFIYVQSNPGAFAIYKNGRNTGRYTPDSLSFLDPGSYQITLKKLYWKDTTITVNVTEEEPTEVDVDYLSNASMRGDLSFYTSPPGANILINDSLLNETSPATITGFLPGKYNITYRLDEHRDDNFEAIVESSRKKTYSSVLRDTSVWVDFQTFNSDIPTNALTAIAIDHDGVKWIGSLSNGIISYDDVDFVNYTESNTPLPGNRINCISVDALNRIWIGTNNGIAVFDRSSWIIYNRNNSGLTSEIINSIKFDDAGVAWIGSTSGLVKFDGATWHIYNDSEMRVWAMDCEFDNIGVLWIGTREYGIVTLENDILTFIPDTIYNYPTERISSVARDQFGNMWFTHMPDSAKMSGVSFYDGNIFNKTFLGTATNNVNNIYIDADNNKWISTWEGFVWFDSQNFSRIFSSINSLISSERTNASVRDQNGAVWITTQAGGLNKFKVMNLE
jgi:streptogramin lyase